MRIVVIILFLCLTTSLSAKPPILTAKDLSHPPPKVIRICCAFGVDLSIARIPFLKKTDLISMENIGIHNYLGGNSEGNGIIYTERGGFIDLGHLRDYADWTAYLYTLIQSIKENEENTVLNLGVEGGVKKLILKFPHQYDSIDIYELAGKIAFDLSLWHEIATYFGASYLPMIPERFSSFSPEDIYSNLLGIKLGIQALKSDLPYEKAMTEILVKSLADLGAVEAVGETYQAMKKVENIWWTRKKALPNGKVLLRRHLDLEASILPLLVPDETNHHVPRQLEKPNSSLTNMYELRIKLNNKFPAKSLPEQFNRVATQNEFGLLIRYIEENQRYLGSKLAKKIQ